MGAVYAISAIGGPLLGGVFSDKVTWRWCFYLNLPVGGLAFVIILLVLPSIPAPEDASTVTSTTLQRWMRLDWTGSFLSICMTTMLELALQWGGNTKTWSDPAVIATLSLFGVFLISFIAWELYREEDAILPPHLFRNMSMVGACIEGFMISMCFVLASYYFPFLYQIRGHSAARSGIDILPFMISGIISCLGAGGAVTALGAPWPFLFIFPPIGAISFGLLTTVTNNTPSARILGYQILAGVGLGPAIQTVVVVVQVAFAGEKKYISQATATITFMQVLGSSVGLAASQAIFSARLRTEIDHSGVVLSPDLRALVLSNIKAVFQLEDSTRFKLQGVAPKIYSWLTETRPLVASLTEIIEESVMGKFDAIYAVESLAGEPGFEQIYRQCYRLLEPRGIFGIYEWCWTTRFDPLNNSHCQMANIIEDYAGISRRGPTERLLSTAIKALQKNHFEVIESADLSERKDSSTHIPWYKLLENAVQSPHFRWPLHHTSGDLTKDAARVLLQAGIYNLFTPMAMIISRRVDTS
ncbi:hypothetical protein D9613_010972 [Agrocybe pediades]|uniref:Major facilitator superfamily (MFS) profile domain-containing protein n=1 Tax=Agrocybe pediades TaxID=84607 RepID=A0A8H4QL09_9AGAR|nr:hypothetical protein D9613_010972 [Agrocybe pediades]